VVHTAPTGAADRARTVNGGALGANPANPASRGRVALRSAVPRATPLIDPAYLADGADLELLAAGVRLAREIAARQPLADLLGGESQPGEQVEDERLRAWIRRSLGTAFHPTSSCAMGGAGEAVCDPELRVRGVEGCGWWTPR
jgi:choline dehydrogenase